MKKENRINTRKSLWCGAICISMFLVIGLTALAADRNARINTVKITVSDYLKDLTMDGSFDELPSLSDSDFETPDSDQYTVDSAEWYDVNGDLNVGMQPKVLLYLSAQEKERSNGYSTFYYFTGAYNSSNVRISGGTFVSAQTVGNYGLRVVLSLKGIKGTYDEPQSPAWSTTLGVASWGRPTISSGYYKVTLYRDGSRVTTITTDQTNLNLYPYMTRSGGYYFEVSSIPYGTNQNLGTASLGIQSDTVVVSEAQLSTGAGQYMNGTYILNQQQNVTNIYGAGSTNTVISAGGTSAGSDTGLFNSGTQYTVYNANTGHTSTMQTGNAGSGSVANGAAAGGSGWNSDGTVYTVYGAATSGSTAAQGALSGNWYKSGNDWYFRTANGQNMANTWLLWQNQYYRFDASGRMLTGFYTGTNGATYYLRNSGAMKTSWAVINGAWYYFNPAAGEYYGMMFKNQLVNVGNKSYYFDQDGRMRTGWVIMKDANKQDQYYYFYPKSSENDTCFGHMAKSTTILGGYTIAADGHWVHESFRKE